MRWRDGKRDFGWVSIGLHWIGAVLILTLLYLGSAIVADGVQQERYIRLHTSIALSGYFVLLFRITWRLVHRHPGRLPKQKAIYYAIGKPFHYLLISAIGVMLVSGPLMAWAGSIPLYLGNIMIPSPFPANAGVFSVMHWMHFAGANVLGWGTLVHFVAVLKHLVLDRDGTFDRMLMPLHAEGDPDN